MRSVRFIWVPAIACLAAACASTPAHRTDRHAAPGVSPVASTLTLCPGVRIANAPATDGARRIIDYTPETYVRGEALYRAPVSACVSSGFGPRSGTGGAGGFHNGVDLYTRSPAPVYAGGDGVVKAVTQMRGYGNIVIIRHRNGVETRYAHLSEFAPGLRPGARVRRGDTIGRTGRTGNATAVHLHYEVLVDGRRQNPLTVGG